MKKVIIGFYGAANNGKTNSLNELINFFDHSKNPNNFSNKDKLECFDYNGIKLGITTDGDYKETISQNIQTLIKKKCDIIVTACRTKGETHDAINSYKKDYDIHYITCPYLYGVEGSQPNEEKLKKLYFSSAVFVKSYIDQLLK
ncbi:hypothetical protein QV06_09625 [Gallibacterium genomosp. 3]|uniref:G domain-containing protein n=1 Tax=Gallibacterium genomosp. 3 TaxID=505345 RepID=A0A1A7PNP0_9PAST|nr:hypothetical protein [Gallibacterium genomosp. 3]OBX03694.1 hypothetical protein QV06_09625 [Gallibacterium genomosp. 3]